MDNTERPKPPALPRPVERNSRSAYGPWTGRMSGGRQNLMLGVDLAQAAEGHWLYLIRDSLMGLFDR